MMTSNVLARIAVDFNDFSNANLVRALSRYVELGQAGVYSGEAVLLYDDEGNGALGHVERLQGELLFVRVDWATWNTDPVRRIVESSNAQEPSLLYPDWLTTAMDAMVEEVNVTTGCRGGEAALIA